jgi:hypothetical protein
MAARGRVMCGKCLSSSIETTHPRSHFHQSFFPSPPLSHASSFLTRRRTYNKPIQMVLSWLVPVIATYLFPAPCKHTTHLVVYFYRRGPLFALTLFALTLPMAQGLFSYCPSSFLSCQHFTSGGGPTEPDRCDFPYPLVSGMKRKRKRKRRRLASHSHW